MKLFSTSIGILTLCLWLANCSTSSKFYTPTTASATASLEELNSGKNLLMENCGKCHRTPSPKKHDAEGWKETLNRMQPKAQITDAQRELIFKYMTGDKI